jgi:hypothetical protein
MTRRSSLRKWARVAGLGAVLPIVAQAHAAAPADTAVIRLDGDRLYLSEAGGVLQELRLGDTPEAQALRAMLGQYGASGVRLDPTILAGSGGCGFHWTPADGDAPPPPNPPPAKKS